jgi:SAM-dependent methyltransferase
MAGLNAIARTCDVLPGLCDRLVGQGRRYRALLAPWSIFGPRFRCPICGFDGPFVAEGRAAWRRLHARCPRCRALERHRLQKMALDRIRERRLGRFGRCLQFSQDAMTPVLRSFYAQVMIADPEPGRGLLCLDITRIDLPASSVDAVFASHVLEHVPEDMTALREIYRILAPGGLAMLPVPLVGDKTIEYSHPLASEAFHVRSPGLDYFDRYREVFDDVEVWTSAAFDETAQPWVYEDRSQWPNELAPFRRPSLGARHSDAVPVCRKASAAEQLSRPREYSAAVVRQNTPVTC